MKNRIHASQPANFRALALSLTASLALAGALKASTVTETFDSAESAAANGWTGSGNTTTNNNYGFSATNNAGDAAGEAGGIIARTTTFRYYADTNGGTLTRNDTLTMSGKFVLLNDTFDGTFRLGFFNTANVTNNFVGIEFVEPSPSASGPFRGFVGATGATGLAVEFAQDTLFEFNLTFTPSGSNDGSGTLAGTVAGTPVNIVVPAGTSTFNAFGLSSGGLGDRNEKTGGCYFDDLTYTAAAPAAYTITYDGNGNTSGTAPDAQPKAENQSITLSSNSGGLAKTGFTFAGWNTAADGSGTNYAEGATYTANGNATLYARWATNYTITYDGNGNTSGTAPDPQVATQDVPINLATNTGGLAKTNFSFDGWNTQPDGSGTSYAAGASYTGAADITLYAKWVQATWIKTTTGTQSWGTAANWNPAVVPSAAGATVNMTANIASGQTISLSSTRVVGTMNISSGTSTGQYNFGNTANGVELRANSEGTGTATINVLAGDAGASHQFQGTIRMAASNIEVNINQSASRLSFFRSIGRITGLNATMTLNAVSGAGAVRFSNFDNAANRNQWQKLVVNQNAIFLNGGGLVSGIVPDNVMGQALASPLADAITLNGGTLRTIEDYTYNIGVNRGITLGALGGTLDANGATRAWTVDSIITGSGSLTKSGTGTATLSAANTYAGDTIVNGGTLAVTGGNAIPDTGKLVINTGGVVNPSGTTETVATLFFGTEQQAAGTWGATGSGATNINDTYFTGTGVVSVATGPAPANTYSTWATTNGAGPNLNDDHDNDGVDNGVEFFLVGPTGNSTGFTALPGVVTTAGVRSITWTKASDYPGVYGTDFSVETSETLATGSWTTEALDGNVTITGNDVKFTFPAGPTKKFARLVVTGP